MMVNGRYYDNDAAFQRVADIKLAVHRMPLDDRFRPYFEFLIGIIEDQREGAIDLTNDSETLDHILDGKGTPYEELLKIEL